MSFFLDTNICSEESTSPWRSSQTLWHNQAIAPVSVQVGPRSPIASWGIRGHQEP